MSREVRMVPADWRHPKQDNGNYLPLLGGNFAEALDDWDLCNSQWEAGLKEDYGSDQRWVVRDEDDTGTYAEYSGERPEADEYMPQWPAEQRTHLMMYETCSEGTPLNDIPMATPEELARWLADTNASAFGSSGATYEQWLGTIRRGCSVASFEMGPDGFKTGVAVAAELEGQK